MTHPLIGASHGKLNWWLQVGPLQADGYHELETVFQELELAEPVAISVADDDVCTLTGFPADIPAEHNLVTRAWQLMKAAFPHQVSGVHFSIKKTLPQGGGVGGGSSNAAWTINAINQLFELNAPKETLHQIASGIGADVAFFLNGGTAVGRGRGEILEKLPPSPLYWLVLVFPGQRMSTVAGYRLLDAIRKDSSAAPDRQQTLSGFLTEFYTGDPIQFSETIRNDFDLIANSFEWFSQWSDRLIGAGAMRPFLCGSGSTIAALVKNQSEAVRIAALVGGIPTSTKVR